MTSRKKMVNAAVSFGAGPFVPAKRSSRQLSRLGLLAAGALLMGLTALPAGARAAPFVWTYGFTAMNFSAGAPFDPVSGMATVKFDPSRNQNPTAPISFSSTLPASYSPFSFAYNATAYQVLLGDSCTGGSLPKCSAGAGKDQAFLVFNLDPTTKLPVSKTGLFSYTTTSSDTAFGSLSVNVSAVSGPIPPVPEPGSLVLLGTGLFALGVVGFASRRRMPG